MSTWHLDDGVLDAYAGAGPMSPALAASVETHLERCAPCRGRLAQPADAARLDAVWAEVLDVVDAPRERPFERLLLRLGVPGDTARLLAVTPSLRLSWWSGTAIVLALALVVARTGPAGTALFLALAPVLPVAGVGVAFGARTDPLHEVTAATPYSSQRLLLVRSAAVVGSTLVLVLPAAALLPAAGWVSAAWLLPALALSATCLATASRVDPVVSGSALSLAWVVAALSGLATRQDPLAVARLAPQLACLLLLVLAGVALAHQRRVHLAPGSPA